MANKEIFNPSDIIAQRSVTSEERKFLESEYDEHKKAVFGTLFYGLTISFLIVLLTAVFLLIQDWKNLTGFNDPYKFIVKIFNIPKADVVSALISVAVLIGLFNLFFILAGIMSNQEAVRIKKDLEEGRVYKANWPVYAKSLIPFTKIKIKKENIKKIKYILVEEWKIRNIEPNEITADEVEFFIHSKYIVSLDGELMFATVFEDPPG